MPLRTLHAWCFALLPFLGGLSACSSTQGGFLEVELDGISFQPLLEGSLSEVEQGGVLRFDLSQEADTDSAYGMVIQTDSFADGDYRVFSGLGDPDSDDLENLFFNLTLPTWSGPGDYSSLLGNGPEVEFDWTGALGDLDEPHTFLLNSSEGGTCECSIEEGALQGQFACSGMTAIVDGVLEPSGLLAISGHWEGTGTPY
ncbi:MAG: hypothetical protein VX498_10615 [Myxococcota bacterium]|nr:hypothetical protein [Myxococcota bacterium]